MFEYRTNIALFLLVLLSCLSGCATVTTSGRANVASKSIAYFYRPGVGPTIVFQSGLGDGKEVWANVIERLPVTASIFAYDRPGYGDSPGATQARDPCAISRELHELLNQAGIRPPLVLVGHSLGGLDQFYYAKLFPQDVAGLVLLDPTHPAHWARMQEDAPVQAALISVFRYTLFSHAMRQEFDETEGCMEELDTLNPVRRPTKLLFSSQYPLIEIGAFRRMLMGLREQWRLQFSDVEYTEVSDSGHYIQRDAPDAVTEAIHRVTTEKAGNRDRSK